MQISGLNPANFVNRPGNANDSSASRNGAEQVALPSPRKLTTEQESNPTSSKPSHLVQTARGESGMEAIEKQEGVASVNPENLQSVAAYQEEFNKRHFYQGSGYQQPSAYQNMENPNQVISPDNTLHLSRQAIEQYISTQYIEERHHFTEVLGVDEYA